MQKLCILKDGSCRLESYVVSKLFKLSATWCGKYYPLTIRRNTLSEAIQTIRDILPGCTNIREWN